MKKVNHSCDTASAAADGLGREGVIRAATGVYITRCQRTMGTGRDAERKSDGQERFPRALAGITIHFIHAALFGALFHARKKIRQEWNGEGEAG